MKKHDPEEALCRALAMITGYTQKILQRSLLCSAEGYITIQIHCPRPIRTKSYMWGTLRRYYDEQLVEQFRGMKLLKDQSGVVFDLPVK